MRTMFCQVRRLREENEKLQQELKAFDLDFFEEIEDLKWKYQEAMKRLKEAESKGRGTARAR
jgi:predicted RNase H-like nuclease (RuvC/YqgF family)